jgi:hypothetical protein
MKSTGPIVIVLAALGCSLSAQTVNRVAEIVGAGDSNHGKCTVEVVVDGGAEIQIRGNTATMRDLSGQPPQWRRFQCTGAMPSNPGNVRFVAVSGRGQQELVPDPRNGGVATVRIEDRDNGAASYTFDLIWDVQGAEQNFPGQQGRGIDRRQPQQGNAQPNRENYSGQRSGDLNNTRDLNNNQRGPDPRDGAQQRNGDFNQRNQDRYNNRDFNNGQQSRDRNFDNGPQGRDRGSDGFESRRGGRMSQEEGLRTCQDSIRQEAMQRFGNVNVTFRQTAPDNSRGADWLAGTLVVSRPWYSRNEVYRFSCSVDYESGRLRSAHIGVPNY